MPDPETEEPKHRDSTDVVAPYARIRVIIAVLCILIGLGVLAARALF